MTLYMAKTNLNNGIQRWEKFHSSQIPARSVEILLEVGAIEQVDSPPLSLFKDWQDRLPQLRAAGIETVAELLDATPESSGIAPDVLRDWQAMGWELIGRKPQMISRCNCHKRRI